MQEYIFYIIETRERMRVTASDRVTAYRKLQEQGLHPVYRQTVKG